MTKEKRGEALFSSLQLRLHYQTRCSAAMTALGEDLLGTVNKLQDLVFNTIGNDSLDLPQIVSFSKQAIRVPSTSSMAHDMMMSR